MGRPRKQLQASYPVKPDSPPKPLDECGPYRQSSMPIGQVAAWLNANRVHKFVFMQAAGPGMVTLLTEVIGEEK